MKKLALTLGVASTLMLASLPAKASTHFWPWGFVGFELINIGVTNVALLACQGRIVQTPQEFAYSAIPVFGPVMALQSCGKRPAAK